MRACVHIMSCYSELSAAVSDWSNSESSSLNHSVADMFESANGIISSVGSKLLLLIQVYRNSLCDNILSINTKSATSLGSFKQRLKTELFSEAYPT